jgi:hypothetical protein
MPETVTLNEELGIIEVRSYGIVSANDMASSIESVKKISKKTGIDRVLVDASDLQAMPDTVDIYDLANEFPRRTWIAVVGSEDQTSFRDLVFGETVATNRGVYIRVFTSEADALKWLGE